MSSTLDIRFPPQKPRYLAERIWFILPNVIGYATLLTCVLTLTLVMAGVSLSVAAKISAYIWFIVMPLGGILAVRLAPVNIDATNFVGIGVALGVLVHPLTVAPFWVLGIVEAHIWVACIAAAGVWFYVIRSRLRFAATTSSDVRAFWSIVATATLIATICFLAASLNTSELGHFRVQAIGVKVMSFGWPPENPYVAGLPYRDNFGIHLSLLAIAKGANIAVADLGGYAAQVAYLWLAAFTFGIIGRIWFGLSAIACVAAMTACYFVLGFSPVNTGIYGTALSWSATLTLSPLLGHIGFLLSMMIFAGIVSAPESKLSKLDAFTLVLLGTATMLARANAGALLGLSASAYWVFKVVTTRTLQPHVAVYVFAIGIGCIGALHFSLGLPIGGNFSGTGFLKFGSSYTLEYLSDFTVSLLTQSKGFSVINAGAVAYIVFILLHTSFLAPFFWVRAASILRGKGLNNEVLILLSVGLGILITPFTFAQGGSNFVFLQLAKLGMCLLGAIGFELAMKSWRRADRNRFSIALSAVAFCLGIVHFYDAAHQLHKLKLLSRFFGPPLIGELQGKPFDMAPILEKIHPKRNTRFILVYNDESTWGYFGRASTIILYDDVRFIAHSQLEVYSLFSPTTSTDPLAKLARNFHALNKAAKNGVLDLPCAVEMANNSMGKGWDIYLLSGKDLQVVEHPSATRKVESLDLVAWHLDLSEEKNPQASVKVAPSICGGE